MCGGMFLDEEEAKLYGKENEVRAILDGWQVPDEKVDELINDDFLRGLPDDEAGIVEVLSKIFK